MESPEWQPIPHRCRRQPSLRVGRVAYFRLHGSPRKYWSRYDEDEIATVATTVRGISTAKEVWCVFDNTSSGAAIENAWELRERLLVARLAM